MDGSFLFFFCHNICQSIRRFYPFRGDQSWLNVTLNFCPKQTCYISFPTWGNTWDQSFCDEDVNPHSFLGIAFSHLEFDILSIFQINIFALSWGKTRLWPCPVTSMTDLPAAWILSEAFENNVGLFCDETLECISPCWVSTKRYWRLHRVRYLTTTTTSSSSFSPCYSHTAAYLACQFRSVIIEPFDWVLYKMMKITR